MKYNRFLWCVALIIFTICLAGCTPKPSGDSDAQNIDITALSQELISSLDMGNSFEQVDSFIVNTLYDMNPEDVADCVVFMSNGAKADEIAIFETKTPDAASRLNAIFEERKADEINIFEDYAPEEVSKLKTSVIYSNGCYAIYCVSPDSKKAQSIIESYF